MKMKITDLEGDNAALKMENSDLRERVNTLITELSIKEAKWCEAEEQYKLKVCNLFYAKLFNPFPTYYKSAADDLEHTNGKSLKNKMSIFSYCHNALGNFLLYMHPNGSAFENKYVMMLSCAIFSQIISADFVMAILEQK